MLRWAMMLVAGLWGCDEPNPPIYGFEAGTTAELGEVRLQGPRDPIELVQQRGEDSTGGIGSGTVDVRERVDSTDIQDALVETPVLDGSTAVRVGGAIATFVIELDRPELQDRRIEIRFWQRPEGTRMVARLLWTAGDAPLGLHGGEPERLLTLWESGTLLTLGELEFVPTGRRTPDGWEEWTSGPVDYAFGGEGHLAPILAFRDVAIDPARWFREDMHVERTAVLDLLQVVDVGPAAVEPRTCRLANEATRCGRQGVCAHGRCVDAAARYGQVSRDAAVRVDLTERRALELDMWTGGRQTRADQLEPAIERMVGLGRTSIPPRRWWKDYTTAFQDLDDGHSRSGQPLVRYGNGGLCVDLAEADLLGADDPMPMVTYVFERALWNTNVAPGDILVDVDGMPARRWIERHATPLVGATGQPSYVEASNVERSMAAAVAAGSVLTFRRCPADASCDAAGTTTVIDLASAVAPLWDEDLSEIPSLLHPMPRACDHRLTPVLDDEKMRSTDVSGIGRRRQTPVLQLNGFRSFTDDLVFELPDQVEDRLVIDARAGSGGSLGLELLLASLFRSPEDGIGMRVDPWLAEPPPSGDAALTSCALDAQSWCFGNYVYEFPTSTAFGALRHVDVVLLNHKAVSANDLFTLHMQDRCTSSSEGCGKTVILGGAHSAGGFSPPVTGPGHLGSRWAPWYSPYDMKMLYGPETATDYLVGTEIRMERTVLLRQSDAVRGVDTQLQAALDALEEGP